MQLDQLRNEKFWVGIALNDSNQLFVVQQEYQGVGGGLRIWRWNPNYSCHTLRSNLSYHVLNDTEYASTVDSKYGACARQTFLMPSTTLLRSFELIASVAPSSFAICCFSCTMSTAMIYPTPMWFAAIKAVRPTLPRLNAQRVSLLALVSALSVLFQCRFGSRSHLESKYPSDQGSRT